MYHQHVGAKHLTNLIYSGAAVGCLNYTLGKDGPPRERHPNLVRVTDHTPGADRISGQFFDADVAELDEGSVPQEADMAGGASEAGVTG
jgi:hypothetical protein